MYDEPKLIALGNTLGQRLRGGEVIELIGDVGAGKTTLTRAIASGMGIEAPIQSPTFTIVNRYETSHGVILAHYDFYRLDDAGLMRNELHEALSSEGTVTIIEWGDIIADILPEDRLTITIESISETARQLSIHPGGEHSHTLVEGLI